YDHEEQEQLATLKAWWRQYGNLVTWLLIIVLAAYSAWSGWNYYQRKQSAQAAQLYNELQRSAAAGDAAQALRVAGDIEGKYGSTLYAEMAALLAAKTAFEANDLDAAKAQLQWVIKNGDNEEYRALARVRLAGI